MTTIKNLNYHGIEHLSVSNLNLYRRNSLQWFLKYIKGVETKIPSLPMIRGKAIEAGIVYQMGNNCEMEDSVKVALNTFLRELLPTSDSGSDPYEISDSDVDNHYKLSSYIYRNLEFSLELGEIERAIEFVRDCVLWIDFRHLARNISPRTQGKVHTVIEGTEFPMLGYIDLEFPDVGYEFKTTSILPKSKRDISLDHLLQIALYSIDRRKDWKIAYLSKPSSETLKAEFIRLSKGRGDSDKAIIEKLKTITGSGTTSDYIKKVMDFPQNYIKSSYVIFDYSQDELLKYKPLLVKLIRSMTNLIRKDELEILDSCISSYCPSYEEPEDIKREIDNILYL